MEYCIELVLSYRTLTHLLTINDSIYYEGCFGIAKHFIPVTYFGQCPYTRIEGHCPICHVTRLCNINYIMTLLPLLFSHHKLIDLYRDSIILQGNWSMTYFR